MKLVFKVLKSEGSNQMTATQVAEKFAKEGFTNNVRQISKIWKPDGALWDKIQFDLVNGYADHFYETRYIDQVEAWGVYQSDN